MRRSRHVMKPKSNQNSKLWRPDIGRLHQQLSEQIKGQPEVLDRIAKTIIRRETDAIPQRGVRGRFFLAGPTGTGKSMLSKVVTEQVFGHGHIYAFDGSEFKTLDGFQSLLGNRQGDQGRFADAYEKVPAGTWLFDEIEKAHREFVDFFLQMVEEARVTTAAGRTLDLSGLYIFVTSNLGSAEILNRQHLPFKSLRRHVEEQVCRHLKPEILNRFGEPYIFRPLDRVAQAEITKSRLQKLISWEREQGRDISHDSGVVDFLCRKGFSLKFGARPLLDVMEEHVGNAVADSLLKGGTGSGRLVVGDNKLILFP